ncbi:CD44 antigen isoform X15 [Corvus moneduloides]|uniref:CD44 antigen isoform X15 n=1 Tax=Corvus moneduloides TaxID=1196302 RepID=UPI001362CA41|nr:CD44 antigen isoform X15 [Corvus moneduloides]
MANFSLWATFGLCLLKLCLTETEFNVSCRYRGVFHVEKNGRYSLTRSEAVKLCRALNSTLATLEQLKEAHESGFETCRYGFVVGHIVIPRIKPYPLCAANTTGIYKLPANTTDRYDAYCYNASETEEKACEPIKTIDTSLLSNQDETVIDNADGSRYNPDGSRHTSGESSTSGVDDENAGSGSTHETTPMDTSIRRSSPSYYGSSTPVSQLPDHTFGGGEKGIPEKDYGDEFTSMSPHISLGTVAGDFHEEDDRQYPASTTPGPHHDNLEKTTTQTWWNPFPDHWWWSNPGEKTQEPTPATKADVTSSGSDSDDEDSSEEMMNPTVFPVRSVAKDETALSTTPGPHHDNLEKTTTQTWWNPFPDHWWWSNPGDKTQEPTPATKADVTSSGSDSDDEDSSEQMTYSTVFPGWGRSVAKDETALSTTLVTSENEKRHGATQHPLFHSIHSGGISQEQNPANTTGSIEQREFTTAGGSYFGKETSTAMVPSHGAKQNDSEQDPLVYPGWDKGKDYATQPAITDRVIPSTENNHERESSTTAVASPDGATTTKTQLNHFCLRIMPSEKSTEGITNPTDAPWDEVLHRTTASMTETVTASTDVLAPEDITLEAWAPHLVVTVASSPDGAHHKDPTQTPLPSDDEPGQGTEGTTNPTDTLRDEVLHRTTASMTKTGNDSPLMGTIVESVDDVDQEKSTKEPLAPGTTPGREGEEANTTDGSPVHGKPGVFSDIEDSFIPLQTPLTTSSTSSVYVSQGPHKGHYESTTSLEETATTQIASQPRSARVPDWLMIVVALVVLALILAVCIAVNSRRRCGQKKKLVINNGKGAVEDRKTSELNGDVSKSQEMVHLVHKEQSNDRTQACDEFLTVNETQNHHEFDMKTGV